MSDWLPIVILPNAVVRKPIAMEDIALVPPSDDRVGAAIKQHPRLGKFLNSFTDAFRQRITPSVLILRDGTPDAYRTTGAIAGFRDAVAISTFTGGRAVLVSHESSMQRPIWAESLAFYPWMLDKHGKDLIANTPSMMGLHYVKEFRGQSFAGFSPSEIDTGDVDGPIFAELSRRWIRRFGEEGVIWEDRAVFRSLNMAYQACMMPGGQEATFYDVGRLISLWVSAAEILLHPGPSGGSGKLQVMNMLDSADWCSKRLAGKSYPVPVGTKKTTDRTAASALYFRIDALRNSFLHGNEVGQAQLVTESGIHLLHVAACLYRVLLMTKLGVNRPQFEESDEFDQDRFLLQLSVYSDWKDPQWRHERAILKAAGLNTPADD